MVFSNMGAKRNFDDLSDEEILALAISAEEDDGRIYRSYARKFREDYPESAKQFDEMAAEEDEHRQALIALFQKRFGDAHDIPLMRREYVKGFPSANTNWLNFEVDIQSARDNAKKMEKVAERFYLEAAKKTSDPETRKLLGDLAAAEAGHVDRSSEIFEASESTLAEDEKANREFILTYIQPGLAGLIDGSVSTLAPIFAAAFATQSSHETLLIGLSASVGAGISMGFTEAISDDGKISGRGSPVIRGVVTGVMTTLGGLGHALPYLINDVQIATIVAVLVVFVELFVITYVQNRWMQTPWLKAVLQVVIGGALVLAAGVLIGSA